MPNSCDLQLNTAMTYISNSSFYGGGDEGWEWDQEVDGLMQSQLFPIFFPQFY